MRQLTALWQQRSWPIFGLTGIFLIWLVFEFHVFLSVFFGHRLLLLVDLQLLNLLWSHILHHWIHRPQYICVKILSCGRTDAVDQFLQLRSSLVLGRGRVHESDLLAFVRHEITLRIEILLLVRQLLRGPLIHLFLWNYKYYREFSIVCVSVGLLN